MKKKVINFIKMLILLLVIILQATLITYPKLTITNAESNFDEKIYSATSIEEDFDDSSVIVVLDKMISGINKTHNLDFFTGVEIDAIEDLTVVTDESTVNESDFEQILLLTIPYNSKQKVLETIDKLYLIDGIKYASPNTIEKFETVPNDTLYENLEEINGQWALKNINLTKAWDFTTGNNEIKVGIIDTGISFHEGLDDNVSSAYDFYSTSNDNPIINRADIHSHGTHVAGIVGATGNNELGICGINWDVSLIQMRVGITAPDRAAIIRALTWAKNNWNTSNKIDIINYSLGSNSPQPDLEAAIRAYTELGGLFICSTGNDPQNNDENYHYPSFYASPLYSNPIPNMISVGRIDINNERPSDANWGEQTIMLYAPGQSILSTTPNNNYASWNGSSQAAPHVTGVAALLLSYNPNLTAAQLKTAILNGSDEITIEIPDGDDDDNLPDEQEVRKLNATKALQYVMDNYGSSSTISSTENTLSETVNGNSSYFEESNFMLKLTVNGNYACRFNISSTSELDVTLYNSNLNEVIISTTSTNGNLTMTFKKYLAAGTYYLQAGYADNDSGTINVTFSGTVHNSHSYTDRYEPALLNHSAYCTCGEYQVKPHIVRVGISGPDSACALCGAPVPTTIGGLNGIQATATYVTLNGSFIAQNGIIYLVDADWDAYFAGTLQFYLNTNLPIVTNRVSIYGEGRL